MLVASEYRLKRRKMLDRLGELEAAGGRASSVYLPPGSSASEIEELLARVPDLGLLPLDFGRISRSVTGAVLFWGEADRYLVLPPFPVGERQAAVGYHVAPLRALLERELTIALVLVRLGTYAVGVFRGEKLLTSKVGSGLVHARHKKGGSSQQRFARHREKQMEFFFSRVCDHMREQLEPCLRQLDYVVYGGEKFTLKEFGKQCSFSRLVAERTLAYQLDVRQPKQATLEAAIEQVWSSRLTQWDELAG